MMELSEGPANQPMIGQLSENKKKMSVADSTFGKDMKAVEKYVMYRDI